ncbi:hypothetical protein DFH11DRAFT_1688103 [Phellopilus nigrolimitatus]|nr:hypothetical protein DFH11DRAFT_1688103 [Phellopilus nigrolimitatus]
MMSTWTASDPLRHPWFASASLKRKHSDSSEEGETASAFPHANTLDLDGEYDAPATIYPTPPPESAGGYSRREEGLGGDERGAGEREAHEHGLRNKRRRYDEIERRMARMHIEPGTRTNGLQLQTEPQTMDAELDFTSESAPFPGMVFPAVIAQAPSNASDTSYAYTSSSMSPTPQDTVLSEYAVEEPVSPVFNRRAPPVSPPPPSQTPALTEVRMKGAEPAWYEREKDRIVITDLDEAVAEAEDEYKSEAEPHPEAAEHADSNADYSISSMLLDHIKRQANFPYKPPQMRSEKEKGALVLFRPPPTNFFAPPDTPPSKESEQAEQGDGVHVEEINVDAGNMAIPPNGFQVGMDQEDPGEPMDMDLDGEL